MGARTMTLAISTSSRCPRTGCTPSFGTGALVGHRDSFGAGPDHSGGGTIYAVTVDDQLWADLPHREEAGSPNVLGAVALAAATQTLNRVGLERVATHESDLTHHALARLQPVPGLTIQGQSRPDAIASKVGVILFTIEGFDDGLVASILGYECGIGVRGGCFCAQPYITHPLCLPPVDGGSVFSRRRHPVDAQTHSHYSDAAETRIRRSRAEIRRGDGARRTSPESLTEILQLSSPVSTT
jgi:hypothetical protein